MADRTAGASEKFDLTPKPVSIAGTVYHDRDLDLVQDSNDEAIAGVQLKLQKFSSTTSSYDDVLDNSSVAVMETTDSNGNYLFGGSTANYVLAPGQYRVIETQPADFPYSVGAIPGTVAGSGSGSALDADVDGDGISDNGNVLADIVIPLGDMHAIDYDFAEAKGATLSGYVYHDRNDDGVRDPGEEGIGNVAVNVLATDLKVILDDLLTLPDVFTTTDSNGFYSVTGLPPGMYEVFELADQTPALDAFMDGKDTPGTVDGSPSGIGPFISSDDQLSEIMLSSLSSGIEYNFGEVQMGSISGHVFLSTPDGDCVGPLDPEYRPFENLTVRLTDAANQEWTTVTDTQGDYSFNGLPPGAYTVELIDPMGSFSDTYIFGESHVGLVDNVATGNADSARLITQIDIDAGDNGINYDFCLDEKSTISGYVYHDRNDNGLRQAGEEGLSTIDVSLYQLVADANNPGSFVEQFVATTQTDGNGHYQFTDLFHGEYVLKEGTVANYLDGKDTAGTISGTSIGVADTNADTISKIVLLNGQAGIEYNFGELQPGSIEGVVHTDVNGNCFLETSEGEIPLADVLMTLWQDVEVNGSTVREYVDDVFTDSLGQYRFENLRPGTYIVEQEELPEYFEGGQMVGFVTGTSTAGSGDDSVINEISAVSIGSGVHLTEYNFCEIPTSSISGYVFKDGADIPKNLNETLSPFDLLALRDGQFTSDDTPIASVVLELRNGITGTPITVGQLLPGTFPAGTDPNDPVRTTTDSNGYYQFTGLSAFNYAVFEIQPDDYIDHVDTPGTNSGIAVNATNLNVQFAVQTLSPSVQPNNDAILRIALGVGQHSQFNNFSEVNVSLLLLPPQKTPDPRDPLGMPEYVPDTEWVPAGQLPVAEREVPVFNGAGVDYTWHLSLLNHGTPRGSGADAQTLFAAWQEVHVPDAVEWMHYELNVGQWTFERSESIVQPRFENGELNFGIEDGVALAGDFNGDGVDEIAIYRNGQWFIDINGNGIWDQQDLWTKLGDEDDQPVAGDWDGDGHDDIGIFGPFWPQDELAIQYEPGLPDAENMNNIRPKNVPPLPHEATSGQRTMKLRMDGQERRDLIDHVFSFGQESDKAVAGDWNGDGIRSIGIFRGGTWQLDVDGDGQLTSNDVELTFGQAGDIPVVGDFNGDGIDQIGVYRVGTWILDSNSSGEIDATDRVFEMGGADDQPLMGDFDGDGIDEAVLYRSPRSN